MTNTNTNTATFNHDDLSRICRALDVAADDYLARARVAQVREEFTEYVGEATALRELRIRLSSTLV